MKLNNTSEFKIIKPLTKDGTPAQVQFDGWSFIAYLDRFEFESLLLSERLKAFSVPQDLLTELQNFVEDYGQHMRDDGFDQGQSSCCGLL